jgi:helix-destabilizing protein
MRFEVKSAAVNEKRGTSRAGKPYVIREQAAYMDVGKAYPVEVKINLDDLAPLEVGFYEVTKECFYVQRYGDVAVDLSRARRVAPASVAAPAARVAG